MKKSAAVLFTKSQREEEAEDKPNLNDQCHWSILKPQNLAMILHQAQNHWLQLFVHQKRERSGTPAQSPLTHVLLLLIWEQKKKGGNAKRETKDRQNPSPDLESQINRIKDRKKKLIANACQTYNTNSKSSTGTKTVCILFLIRIYEYLVALYFCEKQNHESTKFWDLRKVLSITGSRCGRKNTTKDKVLNMLSMG